MHAVEQCALTGNDEAAGGDGVSAPPRGHTHGDERLHLRSEVQRTLMLRVKERLHAEPIAACDETVVALVPDHERVFAAQVMEAFGSVVLIQMQRDLAVGLRAELVSS